MIVGNRIPITRLEHWGHIRSLPFSGEATRVVEQFT